MKKLVITTNPEVKKVFDGYPKRIQKKMQQLRKLILEVANSTEDISHVEETLKWGEPSYLVKKGSTVRMDWKKSKPEQYALYFKCTSKLVPAFKTVYPKTFSFEGTRAIVFTLDEVLPETALKACIKTALTYHKVKHLPLLGM